MSGNPQAFGIVEMCITPCLMELWATLFAGCGKAAPAFPYAVNGVVHSGMGSYAHFHDAFLLLSTFARGDYRIGLPLRSGCSCSFFCASVRPKYWFRFSSFRFSDFTSFSQFL